MGPSLPGTEYLDHGVSDLLSNLMYYLEHAREARLPIGWGYQKKSASSAKDRIHFPIYKAQSFLHNLWPYFDARALWKLSVPVVAPVVLFARAF